jgi:hypothetical protein
MLEIMWLLVSIIRSGGMVTIAMCFPQIIGGNSHVAFVYTHLVLACKFVMLPTHHRVKGDEPIYQLPDEAFQVIKSRLDDNS